eukprot:GEMP01070341.1.p1 GENE.GEMP01070341.1~~GEMP01070341.1.p1  ORF type:complete len:290 (+),score=69.45 GEMP01070341.1:63-932(+)
MISRTSRCCASIGVVGTGQMGTGIAIVAARFAKRDVIALDASAEQLKKSEAFVKQWAEKEVSKNRMTPVEATEVQGRIRYCTSADLKNADFMIEAVSENMDIKRKVFQSVLDQGLPNSAIFASNTSSLSITKLAALIPNPERFIGMHFMNPVPVMPLVEVIRGLQTSDATHQATLALTAAMGKTPATSEDRPGFIANRVLMPYINEAVFCLQDHVGTKEDIDKVLKLGTNVPMGPLMLADFIGLDTCLAIMRVLHSELGDSKYRPAPLLVNYVEAGWLGKKSGRGFYTY